MEEEINHGQIGRKFGFMFGLVSAVVTIALGAARINLGLGGLLLNWAIIITIFVFACKEYRTDNGGILPFGKAFSIVMWVGLIGGLIRGAMLYVYTIVDPEYLTYTKEIREATSFGPPRDNTQPMPEFMEFFNTGEFLGLSSLIGALFGALILGAITAAIMKKEDESLSY